MSLQRFDRWARAGLELYYTRLYYTMIYYTVTDIHIYIYMYIYKTGYWYFSSSDHTPSGTDISGLSTSSTSLS